MFAEFMATASEMMAGRADMLAGEPETDTNCVSDYLDFAGTLASINSLLRSQPDYYTDYGSVSNLLSLFGEAESEYQSLDNKGCEIK